MYKNQENKVEPFSEDLNKSHFDIKKMTIKPSEWPGKIEKDEEIW